MILWIRHLIAFFRRTFVTDCPRCHKHFYGFQPYKHQVVMERKQYRYVCHRCSNLVKLDKVS